MTSQDTVRKPERERRHGQAWEVLSRELMPRARAYVKAHRMRQAQKGLADSLLLLLGGVAALVVADRLFALPYWSRAVLGPGWVLASLVPLCGGLLGWLWRPGEVATAVEFEKAAGLPPESLVTLAWEAGRESAGVSDELLAAHARELAARVGSARPGLRSFKGRWWSVAALALSGVCVMLVPAWRMPQALVRVVAFWEANEAVNAVSFIVEPGDVDVPQGQSVTITAQVENSGAPAVLETSRDRQRWGGIEMAPRGRSTHILSVPSLQRDRYYRVRSGQAVSETYLARVITMPAIRQASLTGAAAVSPPGALDSVAATGATTSPAGAQIAFRDGIADIRAGEKLTLHLVATEPMRSARLYGPGFAYPLEIDPSDPRQARGPLPIAAAIEGETELRIRMTGDRYGVGWGVLTLRTLPDSAPYVEILRPSDMALVGASEDVELSVIAEDDIGLSDLRLEVRAGGRTQTLPIAVGVGARRLTRTVRYALTGEDLKPGDSVVMRLTATDVSRRESYSPEVTLLVSAASPDPATGGRVEAALTAERRAMWAARVLTRAAESMEAAVLPGDPLDDTRNDHLDTARARLAAASEIIVTLQRSLGRCVRFSPSAAYSDAMEAMTDRTVAASGFCESVAPIVGAGSMFELTNWAQTARRLATRMDEIEQSLRRLRRGDVAALLLALPPSATRPAMVDAEKELIEMSAEGLEQVRQAGREELRRWPAVDFASAVFDSPEASGSLSSRLEAAWRLEVLRPDAVTRRAADLALAARAAATLSRDDEPLPAEFSDMLAELDAAHVTARTGRMAAPRVRLERGAEAIRQSLRAAAGPVGSSVDMLMALAREGEESARSGEESNRPASSVTTAPSASSSSGVTTAPVTDAALTLPTTAPTAVATATTAPAGTDAATPPLLSLPSANERLLAALPELAGYLDVISFGRARRRATTGPSTRPEIDFDEIAVPAEFRPAVRSYFQRLRLDEGEHP